MTILDCKLPKEGRIEYIDIIFILPIYYMSIDYIHEL